MRAIASMSLMTPPGLAQALDEERLGVVGVTRALEILRLVGIDDLRRPAELRIGVAHLLQRAAIEPRGGDDLRAGLHQREEGEHLRGMAGGGDGAAAAAFQGGEPRLERRDWSGWSAANR